MNYATLNPEILNPETLNPETLTQSQKSSKELCHLHGGHHLLEQLGPGDLGIGIGVRRYVPYFNGTIASLPPNPKA